MTDSTNKSAANSHKAVRGKTPAEGSSGAQYEVTKREHFLNGRSYQPGETVYFGGEPGVALKPLNDEAKEAVKKAEEARAKRKAEAAKKPR